MKVMIINGMKYSVLIFLLFLFSIMQFISCNSDEKNKEVVKINPTIDSLINIIKLKEDVKNVHFVRIISNDKKNILCGYDFVKNDTLFFIENRRFAMYKKYPLCIIKRGENVFLYTDNEWKDANYHYYSKNLHFSKFENDSIIVFKNFFNICRIGLANCTKKQAESNLAIRNAYFVYSKKNGIIYFDFDFKDELYNFLYLTTNY